MCYKTVLKSEALLLSADFLLILWGVHFGRMDFGTFLKEGRASPLSKLGGQARFQGSTFVQLKFDYTVPENEILSVSKTVQTV